MKYETPAVVLLAIAPLLAAKKVDFNPSPTGRRRGRVDVGKASNGNATLNIHLEHLARELSPARLQTQAPDRLAENVGWRRSEGGFERYRRGTIFG